jgi:alpha-maltose-1-phosphate synthase
MNAAIYYHPEGYTTGGPRLMGRQAAGESFLRGFFLHSRAGEFWAQVDSKEHGHLFAQTARGCGRNEAVRVVTRDNLLDLSQVGAAYHPGPGIGEMAWQRSFFGHHAWSLCGITHTTASARAMDAIVELPLAPVQPWDALICTSRAVRDNVVRVLEGQKEYLRERLGISRFVLPQLPVIPLGINCNDFHFSPSQRAQARRQLGLNEQTLVVLFLGRLAFHGKAHPLAMYQALEKAARSQPATKVVLIECGWHANDFMARAYREAAALVCPNLEIILLDGRVKENCRTAWGAADIFASLSDNIQETFGLTPVEAMAAGLPVVVADWNGYKETVRDGVDGFRIPTLMPSGGVGGDLAMRHALGIDTYDVYCGNTCMFVAVDVAAATAAFEKLLASAELRGKMGEAGRRRAREKYDWATIIPQYQELWHASALLRKSQALPSVDRSWPARSDPFTLFADYPTAALDEQTRLEVVDVDAASALMRTRKYRKLAMVAFADTVLPGEKDVESIIASVAAGAGSVAEILATFPSGRRRVLCYRAMAWLVKLDILRVD